MAPPATSAPEPSSVTGCPATPTPHPLGRLPHRVQLIAYANRFGGTITGLQELLDGPLAGLFHGVHLLPFFTPFDGADAGFDPIDHTRVDKRLGTWDDVRALAADRELMADFIVNHVSAHSREFEDVLERGADSPHLPMFLLFSDIYPDGADEAELAGIFRPRPGTCFTPMTLGGTMRLVWTTFTPQQIDIDVRTAEGRAYLDRVFAALIGAGTRMIRLDAIGYAVKTPGTSSFMTPETFAFVDELTERAHAAGIRVLVEVRGYYHQQLDIANRVDVVYDFALPTLVLHALHTGDGGPLRHWFDIRPGNAVTVLDTHDGIGVIDVAPLRQDPSHEGLLTPEQILRLVRKIHAHSGGQSAQATQWAASVADMYQVNCTFYDALGGQDARYLFARAIHLFTPGIPQIYYVGLLAGRNDMSQLAATGAGREINRHIYSLPEIDADLRRPVVQALFGLIRMRNTHPAFEGDFTHSGELTSLTLTWRNGRASATLAGDLALGTATVTLIGVNGVRTHFGDLDSVMGYPGA